MTTTIEDGLGARIMTRSGFLLNNELTDFSFAPAASGRPVANRVEGGKRPRGWDADREPFLLEASVPGVFAAGDVRSGSVKRVASGVGEGAIAVSFVHQYLARL